MVRKVKKSLILASLALATVPYSFSKMKAYYQIFDPRIFGYSEVDVAELSPICSFKNAPQDLFTHRLLKDSIHMFLYDKKTGYSIGNSTSRGLNNRGQCADFFYSEKDANPNNLVFFNLKENLGLNKIKSQLQSVYLFAYNDFEIKAEIKILVRGKSIKLFLDSDHRHEFSHGLFTHTTFTIDLTKKNAYRSITMNAR